MFIVLKQNQKTHTICVSLLFCLFLFLHLYKLGECPQTVNIDEAGLWYNVQSLLNYGMDQAGNTWPIMFANFHGEQSPGYTYLAFLCCKIFGESLWSIRLPGAICSIMIFVFGYKLTDRLFSNKHANLLFCILCTISPYFIMEFRYALDCNLMLCFITAFFHFFLRAIDSEKLTDAIVAGVFCGLTLYTYGLSYIILPLFLSFAIIYLLYLKKISWKQIAFFSLPLIILAIPLIVVQMINVFGFQEIVVGQITFTKFDISRHSDVTIKHFFTNIPLYLLYFFVGNDLIIESLLYSNFYLILTPLIFVGGYLFVKDSITSLKTKQYCPKIFFATWFFIIWGVVLFTTSVAYHRCNSAFISLTLFIIYGVIFLLHKLQKWKKVVVIVLLLVFLICFTLFAQLYFSGEVNAHLHNTEKSWMFEPLNNVLEEIGSNELTCFIVNPIYYKIITQEHPEVHPYIYDLKYIEDENRYIVMEKFYPYDKYLFCHNEEICENIKPSATYVIPDKYSETIEKFDSLNYLKTQIGHYVIFRPNN